jgi:hypothetical protein
MQPINEEILEQFFYPAQFFREGNKWRAVTEQGRVFVFDESGFDLAQCLTPLLPGETEEQRDQALYEACYLCEVIYGCVDMRRLPFVQRMRISGYAKAYRFTVDDDVFREFGMAEAKAVFGDSAKVKSSWFPLGWQITVPDVGFVVIGLSDKDLVIKKVGGNLYADTLRFLEQKQGYAVVRGKADFCMTWVVHGEMLGIRVIPEVPRGLLSQALIAQLALLPVALLTAIVSGLVPAAKPWQLLLVAWLLYAVIFGWIRGSDRKRGQALLNKFPQTRSRNASLEDARARGMLL